MGDVTISRSALDAIVRNLEASAQSSRAAADGLRNASRGSGAPSPNTGGQNTGGQGPGSLGAKVGAAAGRTARGAGRAGVGFFRDSGFSQYYGAAFEANFFEQAEYASREFFNNYGRMISGIDKDTARLQSNTVNVFNDLSTELRKYSMDAGKLFQDLVRGAPERLKALQIMAKTSSGETSKAALNLLTIVGQFKEMGVSQESTLDLVDSATMAYEATAGQASSLLLNFRELTKTLGVPTQKLVNDYRLMQREMSYSLSEINDQFYKLEVQARSTGIPVEKLVSTFGKQLDTFESSAKAAGTLNALLGTSSINALELLNMKEGERIEYIKGAIKSAGVSLEQITKGKGFGLRAIAGAMGLSTEDTRRLLSGKSEEVFKSLNAPLDEGKTRMKLIESNKDLGERIEILGSEIVASMGPYNAFVMNMRRVSDRAFEIRQRAENLGVNRFEQATARLEKAFGEQRDPETGKITQLTTNKLLNFLDQAEKTDNEEKRAEMTEAVIFGVQAMIKNVNKVMSDEGRTASSKALVAELSKQILEAANLAAAANEAKKVKEGATKKDPIEITFGKNTQFNATVKAGDQKFFNLLLEMTNEYEAARAK